MEHENSQVRTFVNGTLYSLLSRPVLRNHALKLKFGEKLQHMIEMSDEKFQKHYKYILNQLLSDAQEDPNLSEINEDENDVDLLEDEEIAEEDEFDDPIDPGFNPLGEDLLRHLSLEGKEAENQQNIVGVIMEETMNMSKLDLTRERSRNDETSFMRPATPLKNSQISSASRTTGRRLQGLGQQHQNHNTISNNSSSNNYTNNNTGGNHHNSMGNYHQRGEQEYQQDRR